MTATKANDSTTTNHYNSRFSNSRASGVRYFPISKRIGKLNIDVPPIITHESQSPHPSPEFSSSATIMQDTATTPDNDEPLSHTTPPTTPSSTSGSGKRTRIILNHRKLLRIVEPIRPFSRPSYKGPILRNIVAEERNFLSSLRTCLGLLTLGLAIPEILLREEPTTARVVILKLIGSAFLILAGLLLLFATMKFLHSRRMLMKEQVISDRYSIFIWLFTGVGGVIAALTIIYL